MKNKKTISLFFIILLMAGFFGFGENVFAISQSVIINEIQTSGDTGKTTQEFIELYNVTNQDINLDGFSLKKKTQKQTDSSMLVNPNDFIGIIPANGYLLISYPNYIATADIFYSILANEKYPSIADNNTILLYDNNNILLDKVGYGTAQDYEDYKDVNTSPVEKIDDNKSISRKNFQDTNNNGVDFNPSSDTTPQNSLWKEPDPIIYSDKIIINELFPNPDPKNELFKEEFVEIYNAGDTPEDLLNWKLMDNDGYTCKFPAMEIVAGQYLEIKKSSFAGCSIALNNSSDEMGLYNPVDPDPVSFAFYVETAEANYSWSFDSTDWQWTSTPTPEAENEFDEIKDDEPPSDLISLDTSVCNNSICLNEILPNPKGDEAKGEYIEIFNSGATEVDIGSWILKDKSSTKYIFSDNTQVEPKKYLTIYRKDFKFAMNNSGAETISLFDKDEKIVSSAAYNGTKENASYNFDGALWHWSRFLTPGKENKFNRAPKIKLNKSKDGFVGVPIIFEASAKDKDKDKLKYVWDFDDGHKSYLKNTTHSFLKKGTYHIVFTVDDGSEKFAKTLSVKIKNYPKTDVKIVQLSPNPAGNDTGNEKISLLNNSKKKINLKGWKIATGDKKMINHVIAKDFLIEPWEIASLTKQNASFYLTNADMKLELRYPNGKTADKVAYTKEKIEENEIYKKTNGQWAWVSPLAENRIAVAEATVENILPEAVAVIYNDTEIKNNLGKSSANPEWQKKKENKILLASADSNLKITLPEPQGQVLGASTIYATENYYAFTFPTALEKHWAVKIWESFNSLTNRFLLNFS